MNLPPEFSKKLGELFETKDTLSSAEDVMPYGTDWTRVPGNPSVVVFPRTVEQVAKLLKLCSQSHVAVVPSGGRTGLAGGAVAAKGEVVLSLTKMNRIYPVDSLARTVRAQAGATTESVHEHCVSSGLTWPIDLASKGSCTIGGNISTNAGGLRVIRYGMTRKWVTALQIVTMQGEIIELNRGLEKNNTGYDLLQLLIGSEGTLAVVTEATLKLVRRPKSAGVLFFGVQSIHDLVALYGSARKAPFDLLACEYFSGLCATAVEEKLKRKSRFQASYPYYLLMEIEDSGSAELKAKTEHWLEEILSSGIVQEGLLAETSDEVRSTWALREGITESLSQMGAIRKYDVSLPLPNLEKFLVAVLERHRAKTRPFELYLFGHLGDGSPHVNVVQNPGVSPQDFDHAAEAFEIELYELLKQFDGSASSEHGIGILKKKWLTFSRSPAEMRLFSAIKHAFDPMGLLNPGKIVSL